MNSFQNARNIAHVLLSKYPRTEITPEIINKEIQNLSLMPDYAKVDQEELVSTLEADYEIYNEEASVLQEEDVKPWLLDEKAKIKWELWNRYKSHITTKDGSFPIDSLDDITDKILDKCMNPKIGGNWDRRGMVVGNVQSGKTANYTGLINKATDAGYKLIVVIAGIHNSLRSQTQIRIDEGYIGRNSSDFIKRRRNVPIGVGKFAAETAIYSFTSSDTKGDFNRNIATQINVPINGKSPTVLVIKKNKSILENLILWLHQFAKEDKDGNKKIVNVPLLVIDDEADNASVNSGTELDVRTINRLIRTLLNLFNQNSFIGYTATPYANLFIPPGWSDQLKTSIKEIDFKVGEDLFPRDFIVNIPPPSNYIGAAKVFGFENDRTGEIQEGLDIIRTVDDQEPEFPKKINRKNKDELPEDVPFSLRKAIQTFILTCAVRRLRGQESKHNSMLVHVALRVAWIDRISWLVNEVLRDYQRQIKSGQGNLLQQLEELYKRDFISTTEDILKVLPYNDPKIKVHEWKEVLAELKSAASKIEVRAVHGTKKTADLEYHKIEEINYSDYDKGLSVIAVGGNKLARGITLEGLSVSYYLRTSRMYDSLMQMGRWFGYRPGYVDLCRLFTTSDLVRWYRHITMATEEMRADFDEMAANNLRPKDYQLKVRTHPGMLSITAASKMREHEKIQVGFSGSTTQTYEFPKKETVLENNFLQFEYLINRLGKPRERRTKKTKKINALYWENVDPSVVVDFIANYQSEQPHIRPDVITEYITAQNNNGRLRNWTIGMIINSEDTVSVGIKDDKRPLPTTKFLFPFKGEKKEYGLPVRNHTSVYEQETLTLSKQNIFDPKDRYLDLELNQKKPSIDDISKERTKEEKSLLAIYPLDWRVLEGLPEIPIIGWGLVFPKIQNEVKVEYAARPLQEDFEVSVQESDDPSDNE